MAQPLKSELGITAASLRNIAETRLLDFEVLWKAGRYHSAVYMAGYALEAMLKCAICKTLKLDRLPKAYEFHDLDPLLVFSGFNTELRADSKVGLSFMRIQALWDIQLRYEDPLSSKINDSICVDFNKWLNDSEVGVFPWFRSRL